MPARDQFLLSNALCGALAGLGLALGGLRLRLSQELPAAVSANLRGENAGQLLSF